MRHTGTANYTVQTQSLALAPTDRHGPLGWLGFEMTARVAASVPLGLLWLLRLYLFSPSVNLTSHNPPGLQCNSTKFASSVRFFPSANAHGSDNIMCNVSNAHPLHRNTHSQGPSMHGDIEGCCTCTSRLPSRPSPGLGYQCRSFGMANARRGTFADGWDESVPGDGPDCCGRHGIIGFTDHRCQEIPFADRPGRDAYPLHVRSWIDQAAR